MISSVDSLLGLTLQTLPVRVDFQVEMSLVPVPGVSLPTQSLWLHVWGTSLEAHSRAVHASSFEDLPGTWLSGLHLHLLPIPHPPLVVTKREGGKLQRGQRTGITSLSVWASSRSLLILYEQQLQI